MRQVCERRQNHLKFRVESAAARLLDPDVQHPNESRLMI
jgi:hypothetical protein